MVTQSKLILVVGASAAGKDTLIRLAGAALPAHVPVRFVSREITREADEWDRHVPVGASQFLLRERAGYYLLTWRAHGVRYGIPAEARSALSAGLSVVSIASRAVIDSARALPWECRVIEIRAPLPVLRERLLARRRGDGSDLQSRLERAEGFDVRGDDVHVIDNGGSLDDSSAAFTRLVRELACARSELAVNA